MPATKLALPVDAVPTGGAYLLLHPGEREIVGSGQATLPQSALCVGAHPGKGCIACCLGENPGNWSVKMVRLHEGNGVLTREAGGLMDSGGILNAPHGPRLVPNQPVRPPSLLSMLPMHAAGLLNSP